MSSIFNDMISTGHDLFQPIRLHVVPRYHRTAIEIIKLIVWELSFSLDGKGHDIGSLACEL